VVDESDSDPTFPVLAGLARREGLLFLLSAALRFSALPLLPTSGAARGAVLVFFEEDSATDLGVFTLGFRGLIPSRTDLVFFFPGRGLRRTSNFLVIAFLELTGESGTISFPVLKLISLTKSN